MRGKETNSLEIPGFYGNTGNYSVVQYKGKWRQSEKRRIEG